MNSRSQNWENLTIRASIGTAAALGVEKAKMITKPTTAYLMQYSSYHCSANCAFCPQAKTVEGKTNKLSRVLWPKFSFSEIIKKLQQQDLFKRICLQTVIFPGSITQILNLLDSLKKADLEIPVSVCSFPVSKKTMYKMKKLGVERIGLGFDCVTEELFKKIKGKKRSKLLSWTRLSSCFSHAQDVFGNQNVSVHIIIGLGETEKEAIKFMQKITDQQATISLFAFTPVKGTALEKQPPPSISNYRHLQVARYLLQNNKAEYEKMKFSKNGDILNFGIATNTLREIIRSGKPFETSGCPFCNRPYYNESPLDSELYNYPRSLTQDEIKQIMEYFQKFM